MEEKLKVTLVCNAGLLIEYKGTTLLMDSMYGREGHPFSNLTDLMWHQMLQGEGLFSKWITSFLRTSTPITFRRK